MCLVVTDHLQHISKWLAARRVKFAGDLVTRAAGVEQTAQELQSLLLKDVVALQMCDVRRRNAQCLQVVNDS